MKRGGSQSGRSPGKSLLRLAWQSTLLLAVVAAFGLMAPESSRLFVVTASLTMFVLGLFLFVFGLMYGLRRSRVETVTVAGLFLLQNSAPRSIQKQFAWSTIAQLVVAFTAAALRPYTCLLYTSPSPRD